MKLSTFYVVTLAEPETKESRKPHLFFGCSPKYEVITAWKWAESIE